MGEIQLATDRDEIVHIILDYYNFLTTFPYLPASKIRIPPKEGWSDPCRETFRKMGKTEDIVDLLCHLPYIDTKNWEVIRETRPIGYASDLIQRRINRGVSEDPMHQKIPSHVLSLTNGMNYGVYLLLDMQTGNVTEYSLLGGRQPTYSDEEFEQGTSWRWYPTTPIRAYFTRLETMYKSLEEIPLPRNCGESGVIWIQHDKEHKELQEIYRKHGWELDNFCNADCKAELQLWFNRFVSAK